MHFARYDQYGPALLYKNLLRGVMTFITLLEHTRLIIHLDRCNSPENSLYITLFFASNSFKMKLAAIILMNL